MSHWDEEKSRQEGEGISRHSEIDYNTRMISLFAFQFHQTEFLFISCQSIYARLALPGEFSWLRLVSPSEFHSNSISTGIWIFFQNIFQHCTECLKRTQQREILQAKTKVCRLTAIRQCGWEYHLFISAMEISLSRFDALKVFSAIHATYGEIAKIYFEAILKDIKIFRLKSNLFSIIQGFNILLPPLSIDKMSI